MPDQASYRRLKPQELRALGFSAKSRRYVSPGFEPILEAAKLLGGLGFAGLVDPTISARQYEQKRLTEQLGSRTTKEKATRYRREGLLGYRTHQAKETAAYQARAKRIRTEVDNITPADTKLVDKFQRLGWKSLTQSERDRFRKLFDKYPREVLLPGLGSPPIVHKVAA